MPARAFLDTNVLVYAVDEAEAPKRDRARELLRSAEPGDLVLSTQVLSEFYVVVTRKLEQPLDQDAAAAAVDQLARLPVVVTDSALVRAGIAVSRRAQLSLWDGLILAAAGEAGCEVLLTEDLSHGREVDGVRIENPFADSQPGD